MARKAYVGKTCAYCSEECISKVREHVVCKEFFLEQDRGNLPMVPACEDCNATKSKFESYALTVLPFGSLHENSMDYVKENMERRLRKNPAIKRQLSEGATKILSRQGNPIVSTSAVPVDDQRIDALLALIIRGLFMHAFGEALHRYWDVRVTMFQPNEEAHIINQALRLLGPNPRNVKRNLGRGTFSYEGRSSSVMRNFSVWQFTLFGGLALADDEHALTRFSAVTTRRDDVQGPLSDKELSIGF